MQLREDFDKDYSSDSLYSFSRIIDSFLRVKISVD